MIENKFVGHSQVPNELRSIILSAIFQRSSRFNQFPCDKRVASNTIWFSPNDEGTVQMRVCAVKRKLQNLINDLGVDHALLLFHEFRRVA